VKSLDSSFVQTLLRIALEMHDREANGTRESLKSAGQVSVDLLGLASATRTLLGSTGHSFLPSEQAEGRLGAPGKCGLGDNDDAHMPLTA
jgi:hypothetical protein